MDILFQDLAGIVAMKQGERFQVLDSSCSKEKSNLEKEPNPFQRSLTRNPDSSGNFPGNSLSASQPGHQVCPGFNKQICLICVISLKICFKQSIIEQL